jgi:hypothetical protein
MQKGQIIERSGRFYVRFFNDEGRMVAKWTCDKDARHLSRTCRPVRLKQQDLLCKRNEIVKSSRP